MVTVPFSRQEMVNMARRAGLGDAAGQAMRDLPSPVDLDQAEARGPRHGSTRNDLTSRMGGSAGLGNPAGHDHQARR